MERITAIKREIREYYLDTATEKLGQKTKHHTVTEISSRHEVGKGHTSKEAAHINNATKLMLFLCTCRHNVRHMLTIEG
jgi:hypothetical protein